MPELPEVEVVRAGLARHVVGATVTVVEVLHPRPVRRDPRGPDGFAAALAGRRIEGAHRRGKYLWLPLDSGDALLGHLGMSGQLLVQRPDAPAQRHLRVRIGLEGAAGGVETARPSPPQDNPSELRFVDQRMFGGLSVSAGGAELPPEIAHIARDPLDPEFDDDLFVVRVRRRASGIKRQLLDQNLVSGVGNIYADEALWRARLHGERPGDRLSGTQVRQLLGHARDVMNEALGQGGTSFDALYVNVNGESGYFDRSLHAYGRESEPCDRCGTPMRRVAFMNRSSYFCPVCQPVPRRRRTPVPPSVPAFRDGSLSPTQALD
jgi:formamidopyrimidine-DNA glycosylase